jgi:hypothetical protein
VKTIYDYDDLGLLNKDDGKTSLADITTLKPK